MLSHDIIRDIFDISEKYPFVIEKILFVYPLYIDFLKKKVGVEWNELFMYEKAGLLYPKFFIDNTLPPSDNLIYATNIGNVDIFKVYDFSFKQHFNFYENRVFNDIIERAFRLSILYKDVKLLKYLMSRKDRKVTCKMISDAYLGDSEEMRDIFFRNEFKPSNNDLFYMVKDGIDILKYTKIDSSIFVMFVFVGHEKYYEKMLTFLPDIEFSEKEWELLYFFYPEMFTTNLEKYKFIGRIFKQKIPEFKNWTMQDSKYRKKIIKTFFQENFEISRKILMLESILSVYDEEMYCI